MWTLIRSRAESCSLSVSDPRPVALLRFDNGMEEGKERREGSVHVLDTWHRSAPGFPVPVLVHVPDKQLTRSQRKKERERDRQTERETDRERERERECVCVRGS
jgi:hypothetical protein